VFERMRAFLFRGLVPCSSQVRHLVRHL